MGRKHSLYQPGYGPNAQPEGKNKGKRLVKKHPVSRFSPSINVYHHKHERMWNVSGDTVPIHMANIFVCEHKKGIVEKQTLSIFLLPNCVLNIVTMFVGEVQEDSLLLRFYLTIYDSDYKKKIPNIQNLFFPAELKYSTFFINEGSTNAKAIRSSSLFRFYNRNSIPDIMFCLSRNELHNVLRFESSAVPFGYLNDAEGITCMISNSIHETIEDADIVFCCHLDGREAVTSDGHKRCLLVGMINMYSFVNFLNCTSTFFVVMNDT